MKNVDITFTWRNLFFLGLFYHAVKLSGLFRQILITALSAGHMFTRSWNVLRPNSPESGNFVRNEWASRHQTYLTSQHLSEVFNQSLCQFAIVALKLFTIKILRITEPLVLKSVKENRYETIVIYISVERSRYFQKPGWFLVLHFGNLSWHVLSLLTLSSIH